MDSITNAVTIKWFVDRVKLKIPGKLKSTDPVISSETENLLWIIIMIIIIITTGSVTVEVEGLYLIAAPLSGKQYLLISRIAWLIHNWTLSIGIRHFL